MVTKEELTKGISALSDEALLHRWGSKMFTEEALAIAEAEIRRRGLRYEPEDVARSEERAALHSVEYDKARYASNVSFFMAFACLCGGLYVGVIGAFIGGVSGWAIGAYVARRMNRLNSGAFLRFIVPAVLVAAALFVSAAIGLAIQTAFSFL